MAYIFILSVETALFLTLWDFLESEMSISLNYVLCSKESWFSSCFHSTPQTCHLAKEKGKDKEQPKGEESRYFSNALPLWFLVLLKFTLWFCHWCKYSHLCHPPHTNAISYALKKKLSSIICILKVGKGL